MKEFCMVWLVGLLRLLQWNLSYKTKRRFPFHCQTRLLAFHIYIYIYTQTQLFRISILERFWRGSGEDPGDQKLQKHCVLQWCLIATIEKQLFFLGFSSSGERSGSQKYWKCYVLQGFLIATIEKPLFFLGFSSSGEVWEVKSSENLMF